MKHPILLPGSEQVITMNQSLHQFAMNKQALAASVHPQIPVMMLVADEEGADLKTAVTSIVNQLQTDRLLDFTANEPFVMYQPCHHDGDINRLLDILDSARGHASAYTGVVVIQIPANWSSADRFVLQLLCDLATDCLGSAAFIFTLSDQKQLKEVLSVVEASLPLEVLHVRTASSKHLSAYMKRILREDGFQVAPETAALLPQYLEDWARQTTTVTAYSLEALKKQMIFKALARPNSQCMI